MLPPNIARRISGHQKQYLVALVTLVALGSVFAVIGGIVPDSSWQGVTASRFTSSRSSNEALADPIFPQLDVPTCVPPKGWTPKRFLDIVNGLPTDKAPNPGFRAWQPHEYHTAYQKYLAPLRLSQLRLLGNRARV